MKNLVIILLIIFSFSVFAQTDIVSQNSIPFSGTKVESNDARWEIPNIQWNFYKRNNAGQKVFNGWFPLLPVDIVAPRQEVKSRHIKLVIPFKYARLFAVDKEAGNSLRSRDYDYAAQYVAEELQKKIKGALWGLGVSKQVYLLNHQNPQEVQFSITGLHATGYASPEGPKSKGYMTIENGYIDPENIALAKVRAQACLGNVALQMSNMGFSQMADTLNAHSSSWDKFTSAQESEFSNVDWTKLAKASWMYQGNSITQRVWHGIIDYNRGGVKDHRLSVFNEIVGAKRMVVIEFDLVATRQKVAFVPLPLLLLLLLIPGFKREKEEWWEPQNPRPMSPPQPIPETEYEIPGMGERHMPLMENDSFARITLEVDKPGDVILVEDIQPAQQESVKKNVVVLTPVLPPPHRTQEEIHASQEKFFLGFVPDAVWQAQLPDPSSIAYMEMEEAVVVDDLWIYWDLYDAICGEIQYGFVFSSQEKQEAYYGYRILKMWEQIDGKDYMHDAHQALWAKMHAHVIITILSKKEKMLGKGMILVYKSIVSIVAQDLHKRRIERQKRSS